MMGVMGQLAAESPYGFEVLYEWCGHIDGTSGYHWRVRIHPVMNGWIGIAGSLSEAADIALNKMRTLPDKSSDVWKSRVGRGLNGHPR